MLDELVADSGKPAPVVRRDRFWVLSSLPVPDKIVVRFNPHEQ